jgi:hypothetical protein
MVEAGGRAIATGQCQTRRTPRGPRITAVRDHEGSVSGSRQDTPTGAGVAEPGARAIVPEAPRASASITTSCSRETGGLMVSAHAKPARSRADRAVSAFAIAMVATRGDAGHHQRSQRSCRSCRSRCADAGCLVSHRRGANPVSPDVPPDVPHTRPACERVAFDCSRAVTFPRLDHRFHRSRASRPTPSRGVGNMRRAMRSDRRSKPSPRAPKPFRLRPRVIPRVMRRAMPFAGPPLRALVDFRGNFPRFIVHGRLPRELPISGNSEKFTRYFTTHRTYTFGYLFRS